MSRGFEPDACFYIANAERVRGKKEIDLNIDPPPDLLIEIDITNPSLNKLPIYSAIGVPEVWRYTRERLFALKIDVDSYTEVAESSVLPKVTNSVLTTFIESSQQLKRNIWARQVREWGPNRVGIAHPQFGDITAALYNGANSYHGASAMVDHRFSRGYQQYLTYTFSKLMEECLQSPLVRQRQYRSDEREFRQDHEPEESTVQCPDRHEAAVLMCDAIDSRCPA